MRIMYLQSSFRCFLLMLMLIFGWGSTANALDISPLSFSGNTDRIVYIDAADGDVYRLRLYSDVSGIVYDKKKHKINGDVYLPLFQVSDSNPGKPTAYCGVGREVWLYVYKVQGGTLSPITRVLVSSCLRSISLTSQNTGEQAQDLDFSSVQWHETGFSIQWFARIDTAGKLLSSTNYVVHDGVFSAQDVLAIEHPAD